MLSNVVAELTHSRPGDRGRRVSSVLFLQRSGQQGQARVWELTLNIPNKMSCVSQGAASGQDPGIVTSSGKV